MRRAALLLAVLALAGCSLAATPPPEPSAADIEDLRLQRLDALWEESGLSNDLRPAGTPPSEVSYFLVPQTFAGCMEDRGWGEFYFSRSNGYGYRALQLATTDGERLDWYECFAEIAVINSPDMASAAQYDYIYDYYEQTLIPCLRKNGYEIRRAPTREQFRTLWFPRYDPLYATIWNPYYEVQSYMNVERSPIGDECPAAPGGQDFYRMS